MGIHLVDIGRGRRGGSTFFFLLPFVYNRRFSGIAIDTAIDTAIDIDTGVDTSVGILCNLHGKGTLFSFLHSGLQLGCDISSCLLVCLRTTQLIIFWFL